MMLQAKLGLDAKDVHIVSALTRDPETSQADLAKRLGISQPSVNVRVQKLKKRGMMVSTSGIEFNRAGLNMVRVDFAATDPARVLGELQECSFFVNGFTLSGTRNVSILIVGHSLHKIDTIINTHLRPRGDVSDITTSVVVATAKPFVCAVDLEKEQHASCQNAASCENCPVHLVRHRA